MLMQFSVENFRSIREEQTLSMVKNASDGMRFNYSQPNAPKVPLLLNSAVVYGANASGKSSLIKAISCMQTIIKRSFKKNLNSNIPVEPFLLDPDWKSAPTTFSISFIVDLAEEEESNLARVDYGFVATKSRIYEEWLSVYPNGREQAWFHRIYNSDKGLYEWSKESSHFKGSKEIWKSNTREDQLFLSTAVQLNSKQLKPIFNWLVDSLKVTNFDRFNDVFTKHACQHESYKKLIVSLLQQADIDVDDIIIKKNTDNMINNKEDKEDLEDLEDSEAFFIHTDSNGERVSININDESDGTQKLFGYAAPIFDVILNGHILIVDEFNKSLHSDLVRYLVKIFNSEFNLNKAQLIITTHETSILRNDLLRRDQIWFCEKNKYKTTSLYPLTDFSPRKGNREDIEESYLAGRYGGKPIINEFILSDDIFSSIEREAQ